MQITLYLSNIDINSIPPLNSYLLTLFFPLDSLTKILLFISDHCRAIAAYFSLLISILENIM